MSLSEDKKAVRRRTGFENDVRECVVKLFFGALLGLAAKILVPLWIPGWDAIPWWMYVAASVCLMFWMGSRIHGHSRFSDDN
jgi:hypothetical protein